MFMKNRFANTGAIAQAVEYDPTQPVYDSSSNGHNGYRIWGTDGIANTLSTLNPVTSMKKKKKNKKANRFIGNAQIDYKIHSLKKLRLNVNLGIDYSYSEGTVDILADSEQSLHSQTEAGRGRHTDYSQKRIDKTIEA